ncbi:alpha/beta fold hydrolase [Mangrovicoccus algicola]|uniref:Alpha/beta fold hydrolase n=1 Tax=Mangrovicoccus algicola TaxID=2771008 RepID=A0A8J6Z1I8_9RHOB|nr:alpha/beta fold hydrolase [Mangrovicoccus algicola]MBE3639861.1 alpha/beta fold hydrolase [Mangrovicoccus algicola]
MLNILSHGMDKPGTPLVIVHGLFGSARNWGVIAKRLADARPVLVVDQRNHGESPWTDSHGYPDMAGDLAEVIEGVGGRADVLGHSMGGKAAMVLAVTRPELVNRLIVADIAPVRYGHTQMPYIEAMRSVDLQAVATRSDADRQLRERVPELQIRAFLLQSLDLQQRRWRLNLDLLAEEMGRIMDFPALAGRFDGPALFLSGGGSDYVTPDARPAIKALFPKARFVKIPGAGHWLHAEKPREFEAAARVFLEAGGA